MAFHIIKKIEIKSLLDFLLSNVSTDQKTITIYHFVIGSKAYEKDFILEESKSIESSQLPESLQESLPESYIRCRNHECPKIVENLLFNPEMQLSPGIIKNQSLHNKSISKHINIRQVLVLIDPAYKYRPLPVGLLSIIRDLPLDLTIEHNLEHINMNIKSILEPIIVPDDISELHILEIIKILYNFRQFYPILLNIIDCTSNVCNTIYANNIDRSEGINYIVNWIHITKPECFLDDAKLQHIPIITLYKNLIGNPIKNPHGNTHGNIIESNDENLFTNNKLSIRWVNYNDDSYVLDNLKYDYDYEYKYETNNCPYSINLYNSIVTCYKVKTIEYSLSSVFRLWGFTTYTKDYQLEIVSNIGYNLPLANCKKEIIVNFSKLSFSELSTIWREHKNFRELDIFKYGYDNLVFNKFIDYFTNKYTYGVGFSYLGLKPSIVDFLKLEAYEIFCNLSKYFPNDAKYLSSSADTVSRESIKQYLVENGIVF